MSPRLQVDRYELVEELAFGGMATVYLGRVRGAVGFARAVAIKRPHKQFARDAEFVAMLQDEARLASRIRHPNVVPTLDVVAQDGELFLVMEYVHGESLAAIERAVGAQGKTVPVPIAAAILSGVLLGLHAAHEARDEAGRALDVVHRDVSPQNILVGADGVARVVDFGVSKAAGRLQSTGQGQVKGKASYMAPEQLSGIVDRRCDVYAASVVLWELLTGRRLFVGESPAEVIAKVLAADVPSARSMVPGLSDALDEIVMSGVDPSPERRFPTAREMERALRRAVPIASAFEVAEWLEAIMGQSLRARAELLARVEAGAEPSGDGVSPGRPALGQPSADPGTVTASPTISSVRTTKHRWVWAPGLGAGLLLAAAAFLVGRTHTPGATLAPSSAPSPAQSPSALTPVADPGSDAPAAAPGSSSLPEAPAASVRTRTRSPRRLVPKRPSCSPPYAVDAAGHRHFLVECLP